MLQDGLLGWGFPHEDRTLGEWTRDIYSERNLGAFNWLRTAREANCGNKLRTWNNDQSNPRFQRAEKEHMNIASTACRALGRGLVVMANVKLLARSVLFGRKSILRSLLVINSRPPNLLMKIILAQILRGHNNVELKIWRFCNKEPFLYSEAPNLMMNPGPSIGCYNYKLKELLCSRR
jgi:hypothetical protein